MRAKTLATVWFSAHPLGMVLAPLSWLFCLTVWLRRLAYASRLAAVHRLGVPVVVVGNITVGGTGKTPLVVWLSNFLMSKGFRPGIVTRGYRGSARRWPQQVRADSDPAAVGDESVVLARRSVCPVAAAPARVHAARALVEHAACDVILSDDGMQHLALGRDVEIAVVDGVRRFGNGRCLPAGPLRERVSRLERVDLVVAYGAAQRGEFVMDYLPGTPRRVLNGEARPLAAFTGKRLHAVAGIGDPARFFSQLRGLGLSVIEHPFPDHYAYAAADLDFGDGLPVLMTEKDAVKCQQFARSHHWYLPIEARLPKQFGSRLLGLLNRRSHGQEAA